MTIQTRRLLKILRRTNTNIRKTKISNMQNQAEETSMANHSTCEGDGTAQQVIQTIQLQQNRMEEKLDSLLQMESKLDSLLQKMTSLSEVVFSYMTKTDKRIQEIENTLQTNAEEMEVLTEKVSEHEQVVQQQSQEQCTMKKKIIELEDRSRRENLWFSRIPEGQEARDCMAYMCCKLSEWTGLPQAEIVLERAHRVYVPQPSKLKTPRPILCKFQTYTLKEKILGLLWQRGKILQAGDSRVYVDQDYSIETRCLRNAFLPAIRECRQRKIKFRLWYPAILKIQVAGSIKTFTDPDTAVTFIKGEGEQTTTSDDQHQPSTSSVGKRKAEDTPLPKTPFPLFQKVKASTNKNNNSQQTLVFHPEAEDLPDLDPSSSNKITRKHKKT